jgi:hypothetical protein
MIQPLLIQDGHWALLSSSVRKACLGIREVECLLIADY